MTEEEIIAAAQRMIALYGSDAECVACGQAETHADCGEVLETLNWPRIASKIHDLQVDESQIQRLATRP